MKNFKTFIDDLVTEELAFVILRHILVNPSDGLSASSEFIDMVYNINRYNLKNKEREPKVKLKSTSLYTYESYENAIDFLLANESAMGFDCGFSYLELNKDYLGDLNLRLGSVGYKLKDEEYYTTQYNTIRISLSGVIKPSGQYKKLLVRLVSVQSLTYKSVVFERLTHILNNKLGISNQYSLRYTKVLD